LKAEPKLLKPGLENGPEKPSFLSFLDIKRTSKVQFWVFANFLFVMKFIKLVLQL